MILRSLLSLKPPITSSSTFFRFKTTYLNKLDQETLWKSNTSVSNQGQKRGRAKGLVRKKNLNVPQRIGFGKAKIDWPGLTSSVFKTSTTNTKGMRERAVIDSMSEKVYSDYEAELERKKAMMGSGRKRKRIPPLQRGWTSTSSQGKKVGPPIGDDGVPLQGFDSVVLESKQVLHMTKLHGRYRNSSTLVVTGNKDGVGGFALYKLPALIKTVNPIQCAVDKAGKRLTYIPRYEERTVYHDFFSRYGPTKIFVQQKPPGYGVKAHRIIQAICYALGIKDLYAKVEGSVNPQNMTKAFFIGLIRQRTHQDLANEKRLHLVEFRAENGNFPKLVASPENGSVRTKDEILPNEVLDFEMISFEGYMPYYRPKKPPFYTRLEGWQTHLKETEPYRHYEKQIMQMLIDYGEIRSHLSDKFPECKHILAQKKEKKEEQEQEEIEN